MVPDIPGGLGTDIFVGPKKGEDTFVCILRAFVTAAAVHLDTKTRTNMDSQSKLPVAHRFDINKGCLERFINVSYTVQQPNKSCCCFFLLSASTQVEDEVISR